MSSGKPLCFSTRLCQITCCLQTSIAQCPAEWEHAALPVGRSSRQHRGHGKQRQQQSGGAALLRMGWDALQLRHDADSAALYRPNRGGVTRILRLRGAAIRPGFGEVPAGGHGDASIVIPDPANPQSLNRYSYTLGNPLRYTDPSGHIANNPNELTRADEILQALLNDYGVTIDRDWGMLGIGGIWNPGSWQLTELETVLNGVSDFARLMGGAQQFRDNLGGVRFMRMAMSDPGLEMAHKVWLKSIGSGGFSGQWEGTWTVVHELAHAWNAVNNRQFSQGLEDYTGGKTTRRDGYTYGGTPPKGADDNFTRGEDWAESVAAFIYPGKAQAYIQEFYANVPKFQYSNYYSLPRAAFVAQQVNMDPQQLLFLQGNRW